MPSPMPRHLLLAAFLLPALAPAQAVALPKPAPELQKFAPLLGDWQGSGTAVMAPGTPPVPWTSRARYAEAFGRHAVVGDTLVDFGAAMPPIAVREVLAHDREHGRLVAITVDNGGNGSLAEVEFRGADTMVQMFTRKAQGQVVTERHTTVFGKDGFTYCIAMATAQGPLADCVQGNFTRVVGGGPVAAADAKAMAPIPAMTARMNRVAGSYEIAGEMTMLPGQPARKVSGRTVCTPIFGGAVLQVQTTGTAAGAPGDYESCNYTVWNEAGRCFDSYGIDNMGWLGHMEQRFVGDDQIAMTTAAPFHGQPMLLRTLLDLDAAGKMAKATSWSMAGTQPPYASFTASYTLAK